MPTTTAKRRGFQRPATCGEKPPSTRRPDTGRSARTSRSTRQRRDTDPGACRSTRQRRDTDPGPPAAAAGDAACDPPERFDYEWPDLPPIDQMRSAIIRRRVCMGLSYLLPIDKTKSSVENVYRTNLRVMFQEPYLHDVGVYSEDRLAASVRHHLRTNTVPEAFREMPVASQYVGYKLNWESERVRKEYAHCCPPHGLTGKSVTPHSDLLRPRSNLYLPMKMHVPEAVVELKKEAQKILKSVQLDEDDDVYDPERDLDLLKDISTCIDEVTKGNHTEAFQVHASKLTVHEGRGSRQAPFYKKTSKFKDFDDLNETKVPQKPALPDTLESEFLSKDKNLEIWDWLTKDEVITEFSHFMSICS